MERLDACRVLSAFVKSRPKSRKVLVVSSYLVVMRDRHYLNHKFGKLFASADKENVSRLPITWNRIVISAKLLVQVGGGLSPFC